MLLLKLKGLNVVDPFYDDFNKIDLEILDGEYFMLATATYKLDVLKQSNVHLFEKTFYVDMQYNIQAIEQVKTFTYYDLDIYRYYIGRKDQSTNVNSMVKNKLHHEKVMKYLVEYYANNKSKMTKNKEKYIEQILYYMLFTHYTIFCSYDKNYDEAYHQIKDFDEYCDVFTGKIIFQYEKDCIKTEGVDVLSCEGIDQYLISYNMLKESYSVEDLEYLLEKIKQDIYYDNNKELVKNK